ncbi:MAG TPA: GWxTD domain-containing protein [Ignavibacteriales bacterium]|nr:GWxTD domain-containing protein [Ignavibacteriales bacterium]
MSKYFIYSLTVLLFIFTSVYSQPRRDGRILQNAKFYAECLAFPSGGSYESYVAYRIPFNNLVFIKENGSYAAGYTVNIEVRDSLSSSIIARESAAGSEKAPSFENTNSNEIYSQGYVRLNLKPGLYQVFVTLDDLNSAGEIPLPPIKLDIDSSAKILAPIVINNQEHSNGFELTNFGDAVPFNSNRYDLLIPVVSDTISKIYVEILNNNKHVSDAELELSGDAAFKLEGSNRNIMLTGTNSGPSSVRYFILKDFNKNLREGVFQTNFRLEKNSAGKKIFSMPVVWLQKPFSLTNIDFSLRVLEYLAEPKEIKAIKKADEDSLYSSLFNYWKKYDPTPNTEFNELMSEYYKRADHALRNFSNIGKVNGAESDMGKIYILYGEPVEKKRFYTDEKKPAEVWVYKNPPNQFIFVDQTGAGDYKLNKPL